MNKTKKLQQAYKTLQDGYILKVLGSHGCTGKIWIYKPYNSTKSFIFWQHFGQSASRMNITELRWIFKNIFNNNNYDYTIECKQGW